MLEFAVRCTSEDVAIAHKVCKWYALIGSREWRSSCNIRAPGEAGCGEDIARDGQACQMPVVNSG